MEIAAPLWSFAIVRRRIAYRTKKNKGNLHKEEIVDDHGTSIRAIVVTFDCRVLGLDGAGDAGSPGGEGL
jgi:ribosomal protein L35AE/L33A